MKGNWTLLILLEGLAAELWQQKVYFSCRVSELPIPFLHTTYIETVIFRVKGVWFNKVYLHRKSNFLIYKFPILKQYNERV